MDVAFYKIMKVLKSNKIAFTLIELLVVISLILIIASFLIPSLNNAKKSEKIKKAKADLVKLENAISMYESDYGVFPPAANNTALVNLLTTSSKHGPYIEFNKNELNSGKFVDPWGNPYVYVNPGVHNTSFVDLYSYGPDGINNNGGNDDINNWSRM